MMDDIDRDLPPPDHNRPPSEALLRTDDLIKAANAALLTVHMIRDDETAGRFQGFVDQLRDAKTDLEAERSSATEPHDLAIAAIRLQYKDPLALIELARIRLQPLLDNWLQTLKQRAEDKRRAAAAEAQAKQAEADRATQMAEAAGSTIEQQLAARRAQEAATAAATKLKRAPARPAIRGEFSDRAMSLRTYWSASVDDEDAALEHFREHPEVRAAALAAIRKLCRNLAIQFKDEAQAPPGVRFIKSEKAQ